MSDFAASRRRAILDALRRGTVPHSGLDRLAVGLDRFAPALDEELETVAAGEGGFRAVRGEYGAARRSSFAGSPSGATLAGLCNERGADLGDGDAACTATRPSIGASSNGSRPLSRPDGCAAERARCVVLRARRGRARRGSASSESDESALAVAERASSSRQRLAEVGAGARLRRRAAGIPAARWPSGRRDDADGLLAWLGGQPHVAAAGQARSRHQGGHRPRRPRSASCRACLVDAARLGSYRACRRARRGRDAAARAHATCARRR